MKRKIKKTVIICSAAIILISVFLTAGFYFAAEKEVTAELYKTEPAPGNYENAALLNEKGELIEGQLKNAFYISVKKEAENDCALIIYSEFPLRGYAAGVMLAEIVLCVLFASVYSEIEAKKTSKRIADRLSSIAEDMPHDGAPYEELKPFFELIKIKKEQERIENSDNSEKHRREFTANVSHELKTPLTTISGTAEILKSGLVKSEDIPHFAENIYNETQRMITLVNDIIKLSQLDENEIPLEREKIDLYELAADNISWLADEAQKKGITFKLDGQHVKIMGVRQILDEMLHNLCDNAIKYNIDGGSVFARTYLEKDKACISIRDTGIGIDKKHIDHVFERFYRVDKSHSREIGGTGLGLSIVKHGALYHNATVKIKSEPEKGTEIILCFDAVQ